MTGVEALCRTHQCVQTTEGMAMQGHSTQRSMHVARWRPRGSALVGHEGNKVVVGGQERVHWLRARKGDVHTPSARRHRGRGQAGGVQRQAEARQHLRHPHAHLRRAHRVQEQAAGLQGEQQQQQGVRQRLRWGSTAHELATATQ